MRCSGQRGGHVPRCPRVSTRVCEPLATGQARGTGRPDAGRVRAGLSPVHHPPHGGRRVRLHVQQHPHGAVRLPPGRQRGGRGRGRGRRRLLDPQGGRGGPPDPGQPQRRPGRRDLRVRRQRRQGARPRQPLRPLGHARLSRQRHRRALHARGFRGLPADDARGLAGRGPRHDRRPHRVHATTGSPRSAPAAPGPSPTARPCAWSRSSDALPPHGRATTSAVRRSSSSP